MYISGSEVWPSGEAAIRFSLVVATVGRSQQLTRLLESLKAQSYRNFEVIIVDQNPPGFLTGVIAPFRACFPILHLRSPLGLSRARNVGLGHISGQVVAFPDDDCWYPPDALQCVADLLTSHSQWDGLTGRPFDPENPDGFPWYHRTSGSMDLMNLWRRSISFTIFLRREAVEAVGKFDENLGLGTTSGMLASEESEYMIRVLKHGFHLQFLSAVTLYHPALPPCDEARIARALGEGRAFGYVLRKYEYPLPFVIHTWIRALGGAAEARFSGNWLRARYYWALFRGRLQGWFVDSRSAFDSRSDVATATSASVQRPQFHAEVAESPDSGPPERSSAAQVGGA